MSDSHTKQVNSAVNHAISNYQLTSKSKSLRRLSPANSDKIATALIDKKQDRQLMEYIKKRDYYTKKINELLNDCGEETNPRLIQDEAEAEHFIRKRLLRDHAKVQQIKRLIEKHASFQRKAAHEQEQIIRRHQGNRSISGLKKLGSMNAATEQKQKAARDTELHEFYGRLLRQQKSFSDESEHMLRQLDVPFFCSIVEDAPEAQTHKSFVLDLLLKILGET
ncbi:hypothetical protein OXX59_005762 [Metschnikowia pulcherrima]